VQANIVVSIFLRIPRVLSSDLLVVGFGTLIKKPYYRYGDGVLGNEILFRHPTAMSEYATSALQRLSRHNREKSAGGSTRDCATIDGQSNRLMPSGNI